MDATKTLPASWYCSQNLYQLERRAVFFKAWYLVGAVPKFAVDRIIEYEFAGNQPLAHYLTPTGLLFTTISESAPPFEEWFPPSLLQLVSRYDFRRLPHRRTIKYPGNFNWKTMVDGYQECLHCQYTHRSFSVKYPPTFYEVHNHGSYSRHIADPANPNDGLFLYFFPVCTLNLYGGGMSSFRVCPGDKVGETRMEFDYYFDDGKGGTEGFEDYYKFVRKVALEDFELCEVAQENLWRGVYSQGVLNQVKESGVLHYQQLTRKMVVEKFKEEEAEKNALTPASSRASAGFVASGQDDVAVSA
ncbi:hypothetical protein B0A52_09769 [Exophiala mesophila]|uniref:Choline monooxygenase, chloroplastic n=1 Tax=Exophiala mesophila TaxID=212818 RepID=A0A438MTV8_EXOME|nr:hypothetical protein B0A52_09769 [Exophiala mesophila]